MSSKSANYYDFWRSCDTKDWSNDAENSDLHLRHKLQITYDNILFCNFLYIYIYIYITIEQYYCCYHIFDQVKNLKICEPQTFDFPATLQTCSFEFCGF